MCLLLLAANRGLNTPLSAVMWCFLKSFLIQRRGADDWDLLKIERETASVYTLASRGAKTAAK